MTVMKRNGATRRKLRCSYATDCNAQGEAVGDVPAPAPIEISPSIPYSFTRRISLALAISLLSPLISSRHTPRIYLSACSSSSGQA